MPVSVDRLDNIAIIRVNNPPVNALSQAVRHGLVDAIDQIETDDAVKGAILICEGRTFIAGADVKEFGKPVQEPFLTDVIDTIEQSTKPLVAAIHGTALGGGFEVALGCHYRIAVSTAKMGLPEVTLGIIPGAGGTARLPHLVPISAAIDMITSGKPVTAGKALKLGAIDALVSDDLLDGAIEFLKQRLGSPLPAPVRDRPIVEPIPSDEEWAAYEQKVAQKAKGQLSPQKALASIKNAVTLPFAEAYAKEREIFLELRGSDQAAALRHVFFAERAVSKVDAIKNVKGRDIRKVAVIGGGTMGAGIAVSFVNAGFLVTLVERDNDSLTRGIRTIRRTLDASAKRGLISELDVENRMNALASTTNYADLADVDLAIEAVFESMEVKHSVFKLLDTHLKSSAILATNTSYLDVNEIAKATSRPQDVVGLHFFSPAHIQKLLEIVVTDTTANDVVATAFALAKRLRKVGVLSGVCDGFIGNRILKVYRLKAERLLLEGATPSQIDKAMRAFGMPMGPFEAQDLGGLDIAWAQRTAARAAGEQIFAPVADRLCENERFGQKTGAGWYAYERGNRTPQEDPSVLALIVEEALKHDIDRRAHDETDIQQTILFPMINEACLILEQKIAARPLDIDLVKIHGYGFPRWRGGLLHFADTVGLEKIVDRLEEQGHPNISSLLRDLAKSGQSLSSLNRG